jgi:glyoxylase-like metal-dependent hydrolase (beta-lactamase superfamily II)
MVTLVRAPNPSPMTLSGTNSYVLDGGDGTALVIDPGPAIDRHVHALIETAAAQRLAITRIALTHGHPDHALAAPLLAAATGASIYAHPGSRITHDENLPLEAVFAVGSLALHTIDAPGHTFDHVIFFLPARNALFTGDTILGEGTTVIAPPGGAMRPYQHTLRRLAGEFAHARTIYGGHGPVVDDAQAKIAEYLAHRAMREEQILGSLRERVQTVPDLVRKIYGPEPHVLWAAMARQILAHLLALQEEGRVDARPRKQGLSAQEYAMLNPDLEAIASPEEAAALAAEIGAEMRLESLDEYSLVC